MSLVDPHFYLLLLFIYQFCRPTLLFVLVVAVYILVLQTEAFICFGVVVYIWVLQTHTFICCCVYISLVAQHFYLLLQLLCIYESCRPTLVFFCCVYISLVDPHFYLSCCCCVYMSLEDPHFYFLFLCINQSCRFTLLFVVVVV